MNTFGITSAEPGIIIQNRPWCIGGNIARISTHPVVASLDHPLFRKRERGFKKLFFPLCDLSQRGSTSVA